MLGAGSIPLPDEGGSSLRTIAIVNRSGGCGKTTTAVNLAGCLAAQGSRVLVIDADPKGHATQSLAVDPSAAGPSLYEALAEPDGGIAFARSVIAVTDRVSLVPSNPVLGAIRYKLASSEGTRDTNRLSAALASIASDYDYAIVDCAPALDVLTLCALRAAGELVIPVETSSLCVVDAEQLLEAIELLDQRLGSRHAVRILPTQFDGRTRYARAVLGQIRQRFDGICFDTVIRVNTKLREAADRGVPVIEHAPTAHGAADHLSLATEIEGMLDFDRPESQTSERWSPLPRADSRAPGPRAHTGSVASGV